MFRNKFLLTSGCSFTDNWWTKKRGFPVWPELLAKELDMQCINLGKRGLGNDYILNSIIDKLATEKNKVGLVVAMWSDFARIDFEVEETADIYKGLPWIAVNNSSNLEQTNIKNKLLSFTKEQDIDGTVIYRKSFEIKELITKSLRTFYIFQELMKSMELPYIQLVGTPPLLSQGDGRGGERRRRPPSSLYIDGSRCLLDSPYFDKINKKRFLGWPIFKPIGGWCVDDFLDKMDDVRISEEDYHPNKRGHEEIVELLIGKEEKIYEH